MAHGGTGPGRLRRLLLAAALIAAQATALVFDPALSRPALAVPGVPNSPVLLFAENFENNPIATPQLLTAYTGTAGQTYTADPPWLQSCNGNIVAFTMTALPANCAAGTAGMFNLRTLASALGVQGGAANPTTNRAVSAYTDMGDTTGVDPGAGLVQIETLNPVPVAPHAGKRYVTFSVDVAALGCFFNHPLLQFSLLGPGGSVTTIPGQIDACTDPRGRDINVTNPGGGTTPVHVGTYAAPGSVAFTGSTLGVRMVNNQGSGIGNDAAIDNLKILDATPQLDKAFSPATQVAGQPAQLTFTITNSSDLASKLGWSFADALPAGMTVVSPTATTTCSNGVVTAPEGATSIQVTGDLQTNQTSCTVTVNVSAAAGHYVNSAANVTPDGVNPPGTSAIDFVPVLALVKNGTANDLDGNGRVDAGETISYTFTVTNPASNGVTLSTVAVSDPRVGPVSCPVTTLAAGASTVCTATYTVTQADVDAGVVNNTATATATSPPGVINPAPVSDSASTPLPAVSAIVVVKSVTPSSAVVAGNTVTYSFLVTNTGNVTLTGVTVTETVFTGSGTPPVASCPVTTLAPGASTTCTATYTVTQADVNAGTVTNTATVSGTPPTGPAVTSPPSTAVVTIPPGPTVIVVKSADPTSVAAVGDTVTYSFLVTNTGNVTLTGVTVTETVFTGSGTPPVVSCPVTTLAPGANTTCTATYTVTQADVDAGSVTNTATASGTPPTGPVVTSPPSTAVVQAPPSPALTLVKSVAPATVNAVGDSVTYSFLVTNAGNVTLTGLLVNETLFTGSGTAPVVSCTVTTLAPGADTTCTATYAVTQADVDAGSVTNTATVTGTPPSGPAVTTEPSTAVVTVDQLARLTLDKTAGTPVDANGTGIVDAGDTITYTFLVTNTGNVTLTDIEVSDEKVGPATCPATSLAPGDSTTCTATYTITQPDVDAGVVPNTATATAVPPPSAPEPNQPTDSTETPIEGHPGISLVKSADRTELVAGQTITYTFTAVNTGNVTLTDVVIDETSFTGTGTLSPLACARVVSTVLLPGQVFRCTATYTVTQADVDAGTLENSATVTGTPPTGPDVTDSSEVTIPQEIRPALTLRKRAIVEDVNRNGLTDAGDRVRYAFDVTNTGNVTVTDLTIRDESLAVVGIAITCPAAPLPPGQTTTCETQVARTVTANDVLAGSVDNIANATGTAPDGEMVVSTPQAVTVPVSAPRPPELPVTGAPVRALWAGALLLLATGTSLMALERVTRRRRA